MYDYTKLERLKLFFKILFCRHKNKKPFQVLGGSDKNNMKVLQEGEECLRCGGKRYSDV